MKGQVSASRKTPMLTELEGPAVVFFPLVEWARLRPEDLRFELGFGLFGYERIGRARFLKLFWFFDIPLAPAAAAKAAPARAPPR